jgi:hypothetical protein
VAVLPGRYHVVLVGHAAVRAAGRRRVGAVDLASAGRAGSACDVCVTHLAQPPRPGGPVVLGHGDANLDFEDAGTFTVE